MMSETKLMALREAVNLAMTEEMRKDENIFLMGEDVGVYGGDFGTSVGMIEEFGPKRVKRYPNFRSCYLWCSYWCNDYRTTSNCRRYLHGFPYYHDGRYRE